MTEQPSIDEAVRELAIAVVAERASALAAAGLRTTVEVEKWTKGNTLNSELRVAFWRRDAFIDIIEDFITRDGVAAASLAEFKHWLEHSIDAIVEENRQE